MPSRRKEIRRVEDRYRALAEQAGDMVSIHAPDGTYLYASSAVEGLLGRRPAELIDRDCYEFFHPADVSRIATSHQTVLQGVPWTVTYRLRHKSGHFVWVESTNQAICDPESGQVSEIVSTTRQVTDREAISAALRAERAEKLARVRSALEHGSIVPVYQPICELSSCRPVAWEALSRFTPGPEQPPNAWFAMAEEVGLRVPLELGAVDAAIGEANRLPPGDPLALNVSPETVQHHAEELSRRLGRPGTARRPFLIEVTEDARIEDYDAFLDAMRRLRERAQVRLVVDDTGAGFASLTHILRLRPEVMKLDRSVVGSITGDPRSLALARAIVNFAGEIETPVIAEGIEDRQTLDLLRELGVGYGQGYLLGRPGPV